MPGRLRKRGFQVGQFELALSRHRKLAQFPARPRQLLRRLRDTGMLDGAHGYLRRFETARRRP